MFSNRAHSNRNKINEILLGEDIDVEQLKHSGWNLDKLKSMTVLPTESTHWTLDILTKSQTGSAGALLTALENLEIFMVDKKNEEIPGAFDAKIYTLAQASISFNEYLFNVVTKLSFSASQEVHQWEKHLQNSHAIQVLQMAPLYFHKSYVNRNLMKSTFISEWVRKRQKRMKAMEKFLLSFLGIGNELMSCYDKVSSIEDKDQGVFRIIILNQKLIDKFFCSKYHEETLKEWNGEELKIENIETIFYLLKKNINRVDEFERKIKAIIRANQRPMTANWVKYGTITAVGYGTLKYIYNRKEEMISYILDVVISWRNFLKRYLEEPVRDIYTTIRYDTSNVGVMDPKVVEADSESLGRMVVDYIKESKVSLDSGEAYQEALQGNIEQIMPYYEAAMKSPIKSSMFGDLVQLLLIQIQKQRVDVERAMLALDKLLRSNELNFQVLALVPAVLILFFSSRFLYSYISNRIHTKRIYQNIKEQLRSYEKLLTLEISPSAPSSEPLKRVEALNWRSLINGGRMLLSISVLKEYSNNIDDQFKQHFVEDLLDLEKGTFEPAQKMATINRMYRTFPFLVQKPLL